MHLKSEVRQFIIENFYYGQDDGRLDDHVSFLQNGIIDSTGILELVSFLQEKYGVRIHDDELLPENLDSLSNIEAFITRKTRVEVDGEALSLNRQGAKDAKVL
jgi:acyl carrier protein